MASFDPRSIPMDQLMAMRLGAAEEMEKARGLREPIRMYASYSEPAAAHFLNKDVSTLKRWRKKWMSPFTRVGDGGVSYLGIHVCDMHLFGSESPKLWDGE